MLLVLELGMVLPKVLIWNALSSSYSFPTTSNRFTKFPVSIFLVPYRFRYFSIFDIRNHDGSLTPILEANRFRIMLYVSIILPKLLPNCAKSWLFPEVITALQAFLDARTVRKTRTRPRVAGGDAAWSMGLTCDWIDQGLGKGMPVRRDARKAS